MLSNFGKYPEMPVVSEYVSTRRIFGIYGATAWPNSMNVCKNKIEKLKIQ
jgi:hypothetical protein